MATERLSMRQTREILRQEWRVGRTHREVAQSLGISCGAVGTTVLRARAAGLPWAQVEALDDEALHARVYGPPTPQKSTSPVSSAAAAVDSLPDLDTSGLCLVKTLSTALTCWPYRNTALRDDGRTSTRTSSVAKGTASIPLPARAAEANRSTLIADIPFPALKTSQPSGARAKNERSESVQGS